ncbi:MAG: hypothetical protein ACREJ2_03255 [Planctomycetota bacterium]
MPSSADSASAGAGPPNPLPGAHPSKLLRWTVALFCLTETVLALEEICNLIAPHLLSDALLKSPPIMLLLTLLGLLIWAPLILAIVTLAVAWASRRRFSAGVRIAASVILAGILFKFAIGFLWTAFVFATIIQHGPGLPATAISRAMIDDHPLLYALVQSTNLFVSCIALFVVIRSMMRMRGAHVLPEPTPRPATAIERENEFDADGRWDEVPRQGRDTPAAPRPPLPPSSLPPPPSPHSPSGD